MCRWGVHIQKIGEKLLCIQEGHFPLEMCLTQFPKNVARIKMRFSYFGNEHMDRFLYTFSADILSRPGKGQRQDEKNKRINYKGIRSEFFFASRSHR